ncbi:MAG TPA: PP0621 family protein [Thermoanaerobaculia bacterium]|nr:PP0621 family protein [Thermoanaerobaculia bacterium]
MGRLLVLALLLYILWMAVGNFMQKLRAAVSTGALRPPQPAAMRSTAAPPAPEILLPCAVCGTFVPASRALAGRGAEVYCSEACRSSAARGVPQP